MLCNISCSGDRDLRAYSSMMGTEILEKERDILHNTEEEKEVKDEKARVKEELSEEQEMEELRAQMLQLLIELEEARDMSQKHEESFLEMQGEKLSPGLWE